VGLSSTGSGSGSTTSAAPAAFSKERMSQNITPTTSIKTTRREARSVKTDPEEANEFLRS
jgi:tellurite resistance protein